MSSSAAYPSMRRLTSRPRGHRERVRSATDAKPHDPMWDAIDLGCATCLNAAAPLPPCESMAPPGRTGGVDPQAGHRLLPFSLRRLREASPLSLTRLGGQRGSLRVPKGVNVLAALGSPTPPTHRADRRHMIVRPNLSATFNRLSLSFSIGRASLTSIGSPSKIAQHTSSLLSRDS